MLIGTAVYLMKELIVTNLSTPSHFPKLHRSLSQADSGLVFITHCPTISTHEDWSETYVNRFELSYKVESKCAGFDISLIRSL